MSPLTYDPMIASPVEGILGIWEMTREPGGYRRARSLPGHLLHLVQEGRYRLRTNGREYDIKPHDVIYYHETEDVEWLGNDAKVVFYSCAFLAPRLDPLPLSRRVFPATSKQRAAFAEIFEASSESPGLRRDLIMHGALARLLASFDMQSSTTSLDTATSAWWRIESDVRSRKLFRASLAQLADMGHMSRATVVRSCRKATGLSPGKRLQALRMQEAEGLLKFSHLTITQIADYLGYPRLHEFSREFARQRGVSPREFRKQRPGQTAVIAHHQQEDSQ